MLVKMRNVAPRIMVETLICPDGLAVIIYTIQTRVWLCNVARVWLCNVRWN